jgi:PP-loop superfamily ATP-utilizing enzyme
VLSWHILYHIISKQLKATLASNSLVTALNEQFKRHEGMAVAISGGVDSSVLLAAACEYFGAENCLAIIAVSPSLASRELEDAKNIFVAIQVMSGMSQTVATVVFGASKNYSLSLYLLQHNIIYL